jgi:hypothetical protein
MFSLETKPLTFIIYDVGNSFPVMPSGPWVLGYTSGHVVSDPRYFIDSFQSMKKDGSISWLAQRRIGFKNKQITAYPLS